MATADFGELIAAFDSADDRTKREVLAQLNFRMRGETPTGSRVNAAWNAISEVCEGRVPAYDNFAARYGKAKLNRDMAWLESYADKVSARKLSVPERQAVLKLVLGCLADHLRDVMVTKDGKYPKPTPDMLFKHLDSLNMAVDWAFPGYAAARLLDRVALMRTAA